MARGNERVQKREKAAKRNAKNAKGSSSGGGGQNKIAQDASNAKKLADKIAKKKALKESGQYKDKTDRGSKFKGKKVDSNSLLVNPHTGKKDAAWTAKQRGGKKK
jgi:hypothetical protein